MAREEANFLVLHGKGLNLTSHSMEDKYKKPYYIYDNLEYPEHEQV